LKKGLSAGIVEKGFHLVKIKEKGFIEKEKNCQVSEGEREKVSKALAWGG